MRIRPGFNLFVGLLAAAAFLTWTVILFQKYGTFGYCDWDLAFFAQGMWSLIHADGTSTIFEKHLLANHANLVAYVILPVYYIFQHPMTLVFAKILSYVLAGAGLFYLVKPRIGPGYALWLMAFYYCYAPNVFGMLHDFDFEALAPVFLVGLLYFFETRRWRLFMITALLSMTIKENMPLVVLAFGICGLVSGKDKVAWGIVPIALSVTVFFLLVKVFIPMMASGGLNAPLPYSGNYAYLWNDGPKAGLASLSAVLWKPANGVFIHELLGVLWYLPLLGLKALFLVAPLLAQHLLSASDTEHSIVYFYGMALAPFIFFGMAIALERLKKAMSARGFLYLVVLITFIFPFDWSRYWPKFVFRTRCSNFDCSTPAETVRKKWALLGRIPGDAPVVASFAYLTPLSQRLHVYPFFKLYAKRYQQAEQPWCLPESVAYAIIDLDDPWMWDRLPDPASRTLEAVEQRLGNGTWEVMGSVEKTFLLRKTRRGGL